MLLLRSLVLLPVLAPSILGQATPEPQWIHYDGLEPDGTLGGGVIRVDPQNPRHVDTLSLQQRAGAIHLLGASSNVVTMLDNGPANKRIDLVLVGDGYTANELDAYEDDCTDVMNGVFAKAPLDTYQSYFNVHRVEVISNESGVDHDPTQGILRDTALGMGYWCGGTERLLCVNVGLALAAAALAPGRDTTLALANSSKYGGAGYTGSSLATVAGHNGAAIEIALHELGHSFGLLGDEYTYGGPSNYAGGEPSRPNLSTHESADMATLMTKWHQWLGTSGVGTFEGGSYSDFGIYRPTNNSLMRNLGRPFDEVNTEQMIRRIYERVSPIDDATPFGEYSTAQAFYVTPMQPVGHSLDVQWFLDGNPIAGATGTTFDAATLGLSGGHHVLSVEVTDATPLVIDEAIRNQYMTATRSWTLSSGGLIAELNGCGWNPAGSISVLGQPQIGTTFLFDVRNPTGQQPAGSIALLAVSALNLTEAGCGPLLTGWNMNQAPELPGELLISILPADLLALQFGAPTSTPTSGTFLQVSVPNDPSLNGIELYCQGAMLTPGPSGPLVGLGRGLRIRFGD